MLCWLAFSGLALFVPALVWAQDEDAAEPELAEADTETADEGPAPTDGAAAAPTAPDAEAQPKTGVFSDPIPTPPNADENTIAELAAYQNATLRYIDEVSEYRNELRTAVLSEYDAKLKSIDKVYAGELTKLRDDERIQRTDSIARLERFLEKHGRNETYAPGVLYRLAVLHYEKADEEYLSADPSTLTQDYPDFSKSIGYSGELIRRFPNFPQADGAYYLLGFCQLQMDQEDAANDTFMALVEKFPDSSKTPEALTRIGEYHFSRSQDAIQGVGSEVTWDVAKSYYARAVAYGPDYAIYDRALYRLAWTEYYNEDYDSMIHRFIELVEYADQVPKGSSLRQEAIEFMAAALAEEDWNLQDTIDRDPDFGMSRFNKYLNSGQDFELEVLRVYADTLAEQARYDFAAEAYEALLQRDVCNPENPKIHQSYITALNLSEQREKAVLVQSNLDAIYGKTSEWYKCQEQNGNLEAIAYADSIARKAMMYSISTYYTQAGELDVAAEEALAKADSARSPATQAELQAQHDTTRAKAIEVYTRTAELTQGFLEKYPNDQDVYLYRYILADALYNSEQYEKSAVVFDDIRDLSDGRFRRDAAMGSIDARSILLYQGVEQGQVDPLGLPPEDIKTLYGRGAVQASIVPTYLLSELASEGKGDQAAIEAELAARDGQKAVMRPIPQETQRVLDARDKYAEYHLDSRRPETEEPLEDDYEYLNALTYYHYGDYEQARTRFGRIIDQHPETDFAVVSAGFVINTYQEEGDLDKVAEISDSLREKKLGTGEGTSDLDTKLQDIKYSALFEKARQLFDAEQYAEAAYEYERIADENPTFDDIHLALYNAGVAYERIQRYESAMRLYKRVYTEYNDKPEAADALYRVGVNGERFFDFETAVDSYLELHDSKRQTFLDHPERVTALRKAAIILKYTESFERAAQLMERYHDEHNEQTDAPELLFEACLMYEEMGNYSKMDKTFEKFRKKYAGDPEFRVFTLTSYVKQGDYFNKKNDLKKAKPFYEKVVTVYQDSPSVGGTKANYLAAKAQYLLADMEFKSWSKIKLNGTLKQFKQNVASKKEGSAVVAQKFNQVLTYKNAEWTMAALYSIGGMFHNFASSMEQAECPPSFDADTCDGFLESLLEGAFELKDKARENYEAVVQFGRDNSIVNEWTRKSLNGLNDIAPKEYPMFEGERTALTQTTTSPAGLLRATKSEGEQDVEPKDVDMEDK
ncbi:MAG: hypothetical protein AUK47_02470 [Deltaproteobacteria bacterium CG2_30_63_29]|nr:MAG: hypothetical protein AUK47_02470 [Deltaproteobacteria bacterium CG2_30_63_29]